MGRHAYACASVVVDDAALPQHAVLVDDGFILAVLPTSQLPTDVEVTHLAGALLAPGLVDVHVHGAAGRGYNEGSSDAAAVIGRELLAAGITTALPTLASARMDDLLRAVPVALEHSGEGRPRLPGVQLEGPYLSPAQAGAQDPHALRLPDDGSAERLVEIADQIAMIALAPELPGALELTERLVAAGVVVAAGHSDGTAADLRRAQERGLSHVTHLFSGQSSTVRVGAHRVPGMLEGALSSTGLTVEMICDGQHLPAELMQLAHRCLAGSLLLVSDASPGARLPEGASYRMADVTYRVEGGVGMTLDGTSFGGSTTLLSDMLPIAVRTLGIEPAQAIAMATLIPARAAGLTDVGRLAPGCRADLALFDDQLRPVAVALDGRWQETRKETQ